MNKILVFSFSIFFISCLSPEDVSIQVDKDLQLLDHTLSGLHSVQTGNQFRKKVLLDQAEEETIMPYDSMVIKGDLEMLLESSFSRIIRSTNYTKNELKGNIFYERKAKEKKGPVSLKMTKGKDEEINSIVVSYAEDNYLYESNKSIQVNLEEGELMSYVIFGNRKIIGLDPSTYEIEVQIVK